MRQDKIQFKIILFNQLSRNFCQDYGIKIY